jgi:hypothetical protein
MANPGLSSLTGFIIVGVEVTRLRFQRARDAEKQLKPRNTPKTRNDKGLPSIAVHPTGEIRQRSVVAGILPAVFGGILPPSDKTEPA